MKYILSLISVLFLSACDSSHCTYQPGDLLSTKTGIENAMVIRTWGERDDGQCNYSLSYVDKLGVSHFDTFMSIEIDKKMESKK
jgi:hypothetical protein